METRRVLLSEISKMHWLEAKELRNQNIELEDMVENLQGELQKIQAIKDSENRALFLETEEFCWKLGVSYIGNIVLLLILVAGVLFFTDLPWIIKALSATALAVVGGALTYIFHHQWRKNPASTEEEESDDLVMTNEDSSPEVANDDEEEKEEELADEYHGRDSSLGPNEDNLS
ncbi:MAG: hypothetical protein UT86_C0001G0256 [Candidatus Magasanikbacteria bacterium GW2011_GWC2_40_17]|uniref:Uncharacterized protein n=1 Tax=Candidatus Magasanikbacteria bacterium GW2011_GWA2_42_32 TaxID=1619039 RepID=A0A0G1CGD5_9BACT|nr:MAG: hypothetical protein UT86_C0001G0256 [Candidatus Magasanikbacteria bacterium GW2011_GWC2_40_17]KKS57616.1 MAG: hypothetical protein UV20_C0001G0256 [Candidatus Magasanikbacteria bacterium GW2011_GWA2_42_32]OGH85018.1 MAG: hypothetical protein A2294_01840 [Candidatus Magasanikbacteria bacterium RIFOXYB2_FULL_38_10]